MRDQRRESRQRTFKAAKVSLEGFAILDCVVQNISSTGACLQVVSQKSVPDEFELIITRDNSVKFCRIAWRKGNNIGVRFVDRPPMVRRFARPASL